MSGADRNLRVVVISYHFPPFGSPGSLRVGAFARHLPGLGLDLDVVTTDEPRFPRLDAALAARLPEDLAVARVGAACSGFHWAARDPRRSPGTIVARILDRLARPDHAIAWSLCAGLAAGRIARDRDADVVLTSSPPHSTLLAGRLARGLAGPRVRWVADLRDPLLGDGGPIGSMPSRALETADGIVCNTAAMEAVLRRERTAAATTTIPNGYDEDAIDRALAAAAAAPRDPDEIVLVHAGALYGGQRDPTGLLRAVDRVQAGASRAVRFRLVLAGADPARIPAPVAEAIERLPAPAVVELPGFLPHAAMLERMASADLLVLFQPVGFPLQIP
jgi:glycosyltransferase involved in cell wall biosynthesis